MKRFRSSEDLNSYGDKGEAKDLGRRDEETASQRPSLSMHRSSYYNKPSDSGSSRNLTSSPRSRYDRAEEDRESLRSVRKRSNYDLDGYDRRKNYYDRQRDYHERVNFDAHRIHRSESFSGPRRDFPKGFRSERDRPRSNNTVTSWRRFGGGKDSDEGSKSAVESEDIAGRVKSPSRQRDVRSSPALSKESEKSEQSKSVDGKSKCEENANTMVESFCVPSIEREEGELEPEPQPLVAKSVMDDKAEIELGSSSSSPSREKLKIENPVEEDEGEARSPIKPEEVGVSEDIRDAGNMNDDLQEHRDVAVAVEGVNKSGDDDDDANGEKEGSNNVVEGRGEGSFEEDGEGVSNEKMEEKNDTNIETNIEGLELIQNVEAEERNKMPLMEEMTRTLIDKGKTVLVSPSSSPNHTGKGRDVTRSDDVEAEGPSTIGFQFFSDDPVENKDKVEQSAPKETKDDKMVGPLELSLSLPNVLLPIGAQGPSSPSHGRSIQSFASSFRTTNSDGFTASMSFSGSQQITHNPSCSMNHDVQDYEKSVGSKPLFKGIDWKAMAADEKKVTGGSSKIPVGPERQLSLSKQTCGSQGIVSYRNGLENRHLMLEKDGNSLQMNTYPHGTDAESIVMMIASEPLHAMARRFGDMNAQHVARVKELVHEIVSNPSKKWQLSALQKSLQKRTAEITLDTLGTSHRDQLEIMTALRTGMGDFVLTKKPEIPSSDLAEIYLNMRCKNLMCRSSLPVDDCDCKICTQKSNFCRECMCLVCSKFDNAANTCGWVGCDVCLHWCHADCGLKESHIRNGLSAKGLKGTTEMQFYCVACDHPSEMFGFVKEVFQNFVKVWNLDHLSRELEYVRRIFEASNDARGKMLHEFSVRMLSRLSGDVDLEEAKNHILKVFDDIDSDKHSTAMVESRKELLPAKIHESNSNGIGGSSMQIWGKPVEKAPHLGNPVNIYNTKFDSSVDEKRDTNLDFQRNVAVQREPEPVFDELESIVRIKQAEAKMFQSRADDARRESEALKRISVSKSERVEEEYRSRINKLRLAEAEEMRKQKIEQLQAIEGSYQEYLSMKMRMESEIKDLLLTMESARRNLTR